MRSTRDLLQDLMACHPVSNDVEAVNGAVALLRGELEEAGVWTTVERFEGRDILYAAAIEGERTPEILLNAHLDVVPAADDLFVLREENGKWYGRGTLDCLGNSVTVAAVLSRAVGTASVGAIFSTDEEIGGATTAEMVARGYGAGKCAIVLDGAGYALIVGQKGVLTVRLTAEGVACHAAEPWRGENAIDRLIHEYGKIQELFPFVQPPDTWRNTMAVTRISGGTASNRVPDSAEMTLNIRYTDETTADDLLERIRETVDIHVEPVMQCPPVSFSPDTPILQRLLECMRRTLERDIAIERLNGATDARHFLKLGIPIAIVGVPGGDPHGRREHVDPAGIDAYIRMLSAFVTEEARTL